MAVRTKQAHFQLKADFMPLTVMHLHSVDVAGMDSQLKKKVTQAPAYLKDAPMILDVQGITEFAEFDMGALCGLFKQYEITLIGIRGLPTSHQPAAEKHGLPLLHKRPASNANTVKSPSSSQKKQAQPTLVIKTPIRSGRQVYAKDSDLIVMASVNAGAECIADGNIHVYGPLRGKAIAGAQGDENAQIFCEELNAELIAVAGQYMVNEDIQLPKTNKRMIRVYLKNNSLQIEGI